MLGATIIMLVGPWAHRSMGPVMDVRGTIHEESTKRDLIGNGFSRGAGRSGEMMTLIFRGARVAGEASGVPHFKLRQERPETTLVQGAGTSDQQESTDQCIIERRRREQVISIWSARRPRHADRSARQAFVRRPWPKHVAKKP